MTSKLQSMVAALSQTPIANKCKMRRHLLVGFLLFVLLFAFRPSPIKAAREIWVPDEYPTIQEAIDAAEDGDKINVVARAQPYYEHIDIDKNVAIIGHLTPIIDGDGDGIVVDIKHNDVSFSGFRVQRGRCGIAMRGRSNCIIENNRIYDNYYGIMLEECSNIKISGNRLTDYGKTGYTKYSIMVTNSSSSQIEENIIYAHYGILVDGSLSYNNTLANNAIRNSKFGLYIQTGAYENTLFNNTLNNCMHGTYMSNTHHNTISYNSFSEASVFMFGSSTSNLFFHNSFTYASVVNVTAGNAWNMIWPTGGNYWHNHESPDVMTGQFQNLTGSDGICDIAYDVGPVIVDNYPLKGRSKILTLTIEGVDYLINIISNSTISDFQINATESSISLQANGPTGTGFCRADIPSDLMPAPYTIFVNGIETPYTTPYSANTIYFTYTHTRQEEVATDWPMFQYDLTRSGHSSTFAPDNNSTLWTYDASSSQISSPVVVAGKIYFGSYGKVQCLNASTSESLWNYTTYLGWGAVHTPSVVDDRVYVGSNDYRVYCLNASTGEYIWSFNTLGNISPSPAVSDERVYVGSGDNWFYCLNASTGTLIWKYETGYDIIWSSAALANGLVYVGSEDHNVYCLNTSTGTSIWNFTTGTYGYVHSSPAISEGRVFFGSDDKKVYCVDAFTGGLIWNYTTDDVVLSSPAVADNRVYVGSGDSDRRLYCLNATTGALIWNYKTSGPVHSSPAVAGGRVYFGSYDGNVYCLDALTGMLVWSYQTADIVEASPAIADERIYIASADSLMYAFGTEVAVFPESPAILVEPQMIDFGGKPVDYPAELNQTTITNEGLEPLTVESISLTSDGGGAFTIYNIVQEGPLGALFPITTPFVLNPGRSAYVLVEFDDVDEDAGLFVGTLQILSDDPNNMTVEVSLYGAGQTASGCSTVIMPTEPTSEYSGTFELAIDAEGNITQLTEFADFNILDSSVTTTEDKQGIFLEGALQNPDLVGQKILEVTSENSTSKLSVYNIIIITSPAAFEFSYFEVPVENDTYLVETWSNSTVTDLTFSQSLMSISLSLYGTTGTTGLCNITVPADFMWGDFTLYLDDTLLTESVDYTESYNDTHYTFSIHYAHSSHIIELISTSVVPDFAGWLFLPFLISATLLGFALRKRLKKHRPV